MAAPLGSPETQSLASVVTGGSGNLASGAGAASDGKGSAGFSGGVSGGLSATCSAGFSVGFSGVTSGGLESSAAVTIDGASGVAASGRGGSAAGVGCSAIFAGGSSIGSGDLAAVVRPLPRAAGVRCVELHRVAAVELIVFVSAGALIAWLSNRKGRLVGAVVGSGIASIGAAVHEQQTHAALVAAAAGGDKVNGRRITQQQ